MYSLIKSQLLNPLYDTYSVLIATTKYISFYKSELLTRLAVPCVLFMMFAFIGQYYNIHPLASTLVLIILLMKTAMVIHRVFILGPEAVPKYGIDKFNKRELNYVSLQVLSILVIMIVPILILTITSNILTVDDWPNNAVEQSISLFQWVAYYLVARASLLFPAVSIDKKLTLRQAWVASSQYKLLLFSTVALIPFVITSLAKFLLSDVNLHWLSMAMFLIVTMYTVAILSIVYKRIDDEISLSKDDAIH